MHLRDDNQILRIDQLRTEDAGVYTCIAENTLQRISASTDLRVREPSKCMILAGKFVALPVLMPVMFSSAVLLSSNVQFNHV